jgi:hypothetical protein
MALEALQTGHEPAGSMHVIPIVITESGDEVFLLLPGYL